MKSNSQSYKEPNFLASSTVRPLLMTVSVNKTVQPGDVYVVGSQAKGIVFTGREVSAGDNAPVSVMFGGVVYGNRVNGLTAEYKKQLADAGFKFVEDFNVDTSTQATPTSAATSQSDQGGNK
ncbi:hypothetical protein [Fructobacillus tropaeoli]|uniref:Uncharacterized protein n=1 Tax=Fructobacillus tropaeoli TaxID=709323 RepID=A0ABN9YK70_9LACO|nr:hypothetical protein [Fructobacillus tropaeoli]GIC70610.1 hypothetical protein FT12353_12860 [Fructobacillus tropaeoli]CAK1228499.1 unnamed protein product [Fructobacillus tropaeoli]CAK1234954.1 unnamed protein product [Fructobacillus tropaeoli]